MNIIAIFIFFILIGGLMYVIVFRPYTKRHYDHGVMLDSLRKGDIVYTEDGIKASVDRINNRKVVLLVYPDRRRMEMDMEEIVEVENYDRKVAEYRAGEKAKKHRTALEEKRRAREECEREENLRKKEERQRKKLEKKHK